MSLSSEVVEKHVNEAHRLFQISTLSAAGSGFAIGATIPSDLAPIVLKVEEAIKRRVALNTKISYTRLVEELAIKFQSSRAIELAVINMIKGEELVALEGRKFLQRKK